jgi:putative tryptophan/tyrosine transport system substrate-binding protein
MRRREFIALAGTAIAFLSVSTRAQQLKLNKPARIATLSNLDPIRGWFVDAMREKGWLEERDFILVQSHYQHGDPNLDEAVAGVVASKPDLILVTSLHYALAAHRITKTIPIVMLFSGYPVEGGLADSLAKPGKNVTGNAIYAGTGIWSKLLQLLCELKPDVQRVGVLWTYVPPTFPKGEIEPCYRDLRSAEQSLGLKVDIIEVANTAEMPRALAQVESTKPGALLLTSNMSVAVKATVMDFTVTNRLPTITDLNWESGVQVRPLLAYSADVRELMQGAVGSTVKILEGERPGDIPIRQPARFEMVVNLKTARAIGLTIPQSILLRADRVIE